MERLVILRNLWKDLLSLEIYGKMVIFKLIMDIKLVIGKYTKGVILICIFLNFFSKGIPNRLFSLLSILFIILYYLYYLT